MYKSLYKCSLNGSIPAFSMIIKDISPTMSDYITSSLTFELTFMLTGYVLVQSHNNA